MVLGGQRGKLKVGLKVKVKVAQYVFASNTDVTASNPDVPASYDCTC